MACFEIQKGKTKRAPAWFPPTQAGIPVAWTAEGVEGGGQLICKHTAK